MTIPRVDGWLDTIGPALQNIIGAGIDIAKPHLRTQRAVKQKIIDDPEYLQKLADIHSMDPNFLASQGLQDYIPAVERLGKSPERRTKEAVATKTEFGANAIESLDSAETRDAQRASMGLPTLAQAELIQLQLAGKDLDNQLGTLNLQRTYKIIQDEDLSRAADKSANEYLGKLPKGANLYQLYTQKAFSPDVSQWLMTSKTFKDRFMLDSDIYFKQQNLLNDRERLRIARSQAHEGDAIQRMILSNRMDSAQTISKALGHSIAPDEIYNILSVPNITIEGIKHLAQARSQKDASIDPQTASIWRLGKALVDKDKEVYAELEFNTKRKLNGMLQTISAIQKDRQTQGGQEANLANAVQMFNDVAISASDLLGKDVPTIKLDEKGFGFFDKGGKAILNVPAKDIGKYTDIDMINGSTDVTRYLQEYEQIKKSYPNLTLEEYATEAARKYGDSTLKDKILKKR